MSRQTIEIKFDVLSKKLKNWLALYISLIKNNIDNGKNLKIKFVDSNIKSEEIAFCSDLPPAMLSLNAYLDIQSVKSICFDVEINEYKLSNLTS